MGLRSQLRRHRHDLRLIVGGLSALLLVVSGAFYFLLNSRELERSLTTNRVLLFFLWNANLLLILTILFVLLRLVFKIVVERRLRILGSKFKTKLIGSYIGLSLIPVLLLFFLANQLLTGSIDRWFNVDLKRMVDNSRDITDAFNQRVEEGNRRIASLTLQRLGEERGAELARRPDLDSELRELMEVGGIHALTVYEGTDFVRGVVTPRLVDLPEMDWNFLRKAMAEGQATRVRPMPGLDLRLSLVAVASRITGPQDEAPAEEGAEGDERPPPLVVVAATALEPYVAERMVELVNAHQAHQQVVVLEPDIRNTSLLLFLMATLLILMASCWVGLYLARRVTVPIQALARGTGRIIEGDLSYRVEVDAGDELGVLVDSFNRMTAELDRNRVLVERGNQELREANKRQAEERALIAAVLQNVSAGIISLDQEGRIFTCNGAARAMLRLREEVRGKTPAEAWQDPERAKLVALVEVAEGLRARVSRQLQLILRGEWKTLEVTLTPILDGEGELMGRVMVLEDLTDLIKAQKLAAWTEAARRIAHEIKNPLTPIKLSAERLLRKAHQGDGKLGEAVEDAVEIIVREVGTIQTMVDEFSRYARMPQPQPAEVDLEKLVAETLTLYQDLKPGVTVEATVPEAARSLYLDGEQLKRALINLLDNALEATEAPGAVTVSAERNNGLVRIHVADTGRGIPADSKEKLFLPYFSTKGRGTGLGLAIVHRIVSDHHGRIRVEDNKPKGTVFTVELPVR